MAPCRRDRGRARTRGRGVALRPAGGGGGRGGGGRTRRGWAGGGGRGGGGGGGGGRGGGGGGGGGGGAPGQTGDGAQAGGGPPDQEPPVALNADSPIQYPPRLYDQKVEGDVILRLFVDSAGRLQPESSRVAESSGYPALDSAALTGARKLRFAPARRHGLSIAAAFMQPIEFRHPAASGAVIRGAPDTAPPATARTAPPPPPPPPPPPRRAAPRPAP